MHEIRAALVAIENQLMLLTTSDARQQEQVEALRRDLQRLQERLQAVEKLPMIRNQLEKGR